VGKIAPTVNAKPPQAAFLLPAFKRVFSFGGPTDRMFYSKTFQSGVHMDEFISVFEVLTAVAKCATAWWIFVNLKVKKSKKRRTHK